MGSDAAEPHRAVAVEGPQAVGLELGFVVSPTDLEDKPLSVGALRRAGKSAARGSDTLGAMEIVPTTGLEPGNFSVELLGRDHGDPGVSLILVDAAPGRGPSLHTHDYAEIIIVQEGTATFTDGETSREVGAGHVVIIGAGEPHAFTNTGEGRLRQVDIHVADAFATEWLA